MTHVGIIGAGNIGSAIAQVLVAQGHQVAIANSRGPETLAGLVAELGENAQAITAADAAAFGEWVVVTVPLKAIDDLPVAELAGKIVVDTNNYYWERDGHHAAIDAAETTPSEVLQAHLPDSSVVKLFNAIQADHLLTQGVASGERRALPMAGDSAEAKATVAALTDEIGYDVVDVGPLAESWRFDRDQPAYGPRADAAGLAELLGRATRASASA